MIQALALALSLAAAAPLPDRGPWLVALSSSSAETCRRLGGVEGCRPAEGFSLPGPAEPLRFAAFGDGGKATPAQRAVARLLKARAPRLLLLLGDIVYPRGSDEDYGPKYFEPYAEVLPRVPFFPAIGNHDYGNHGPAAKGRAVFEAVYRRIHRRPAYYSFDAGPVHFVSLDTNEAYGIGAAAPVGPGSAQARWLEEDLARSKAPWKVVFLHVPLYTSKRGHGDNLFLRAALAPILRRGGVRLVLQGHDHFYERTKPLDGIVYATAGTGGAGLYRPWGAAPDWVEARHRRHGLLLAEADQRTLSWEFIADDGTVLDRARLERTD